MVAARKKKSAKRKWLKLQLPAAAQMNEEEEI